MAAQKNPSSDDLANIIADTINKKFKTKGVSFKTAYYLTDPEVISDVTDFVSTGSSMLDIAISNRPGGGIPVGRITEIFGMEASGKSLLGAQIIAQTQKKGGLGIYIDTEAAISREFYQALGVDVDKMLYLPIDSLEDIFEAIEAMISSVRNNDKKRLVTIVVDSIMGSSTKKELEGDYDKEGWNTDKAIILSKAMRKLPNLIAYQNVALVFTNQLRSKLGVSFGDPWCVDPYTTKVKIRYSL